MKLRKKKSWEFEVAALPSGASAASPLAWFSVGVDGLEIFDARRR